MNASNSTTLNIKSMLVRSAVFTAVLAGMTPVLAATAVVNGNANPNLAGRDSGYTCCDGDSAPDQSPTLVSGLQLNAGDVLHFSASGEVSYSGAAPGGNNPDGHPDVGILFSFNDGISTPVNMDRVVALVGVFLGVDSPTGAPTPEPLDFSGGLDFMSIAPQIGQIFFIGNGLTGDTQLGDYGGAVQNFIVPTGATRLYLGTTDGFGWYNNNGSFNVEITTVPEPETYAMLLAGLGLLGFMARRRKQAPVVPDLRLL